MKLLEKENLLIVTGRPKKKVAVIHYYRVVESLPDQKGVESTWRRRDYLAINTKEAAELDHQKNQATWAA